jgi:hypothetical protein
MQGGLTAGIDTAIGKAFTQNKAERERTVCSWVPNGYPLVLSF